MVNTLKICTFKVSHVPFNVQILTKPLNHSKMLILFSSKFYGNISTIEPYQINHCTFNNFYARTIIDFKKDISAVFFKKQIPFVKSNASLCDLLSILVILYVFSLKYFFFHPSSILYFSSGNYTEQTRLMRVHSTTEHYAPHSSKTA